MATVHTMRQKRYARTRNLQIGTLTQCSGNGAGGSERLAATNRLFLEFERQDNDGVPVKTTMTLDRAEALEIYRRILRSQNPKDPIHDLWQLADENWRNV